MDDPRWLRLIIIGLVLAALVVGYMLFTGKFSSNLSTRVQSSPSPTVLGQNTTTPPTPTPSPTPSSAYTRIVNRSQGNVQTLPNTGFPLEIAVFSISGMFIGWGLRRFPK